MLDPAWDPTFMSNCYLCQQELCSAKVQLAMCDCALCCFTSEDRTWFIDGKYGTIHDGSEIVKDVLFEENLMAVFDSVTNDVDSQFSEQPFK